MRASMGAARGWPVRSLSCAATTGWHGEIITSASTVKTRAARAARTTGAMVAEVGVGVGVSAVGEELVVLMVVAAGSEGGVMGWKTG